MSVISFGRAARRDVTQTLTPPAATAQPGEPFVRSRAVLAMLGQRAAPASIEDLFWEPVVAQVRRWLPISLRQIFAPALRMTIRKPRPVDLDGQAIFLDEHDAPFILKASGEPVYVHVYRIVSDGAETLLTAPNPDPVRRYMSPEDRTRLALRYLVEDMAAGRSERIAVLSDVTPRKLTDEGRSAG
ncbi:MAG: hypothetical protein AAF526_07285 [Pseudomonadota bacterium]